MNKRSSETNGDLSNGRTKRPKVVAETKVNGVVKKARGTSATRSHARPIINQIPKLSKELLNVYCFGSGTICELGLGPNVVEVKRPRLNPFLPSDTIGIVELAVGGAHVIAIDHQGRLWTWGQNDSGVLGRDTQESELEIDEDAYLNAKESTPHMVTGIPPNIKFVSVAASDNLSAAVTSDGHLWAWGTFIDDGDKAYKSGIAIQKSPIQVPQLRGIVQAAGGSDHILILDKYGDVYAWGTGGNCQLGHQINPRLRTKTFGPLKILGLKDIKYIEAGSVHSFAIDVNNKLWAWGLNNFGQCGISEGVGPGASVTEPTLVNFFADKKVTQVAGGSHHTAILTDEGEIYTMGEMNFHQTGVPNSQLPESTVREQDGTPSYIPVPVKLKLGSDKEESVPLPKFKYVAAGVDHSLAISADDGSAWTWGFGEVYQLGHGKPAGEDSPEDEPIPTRIRNTATTGVNMVFAGAGGQFSVLAGLPSEH
jgi:regulator of chromosome condensation